MNLKQHSKLKIVLVLITFGLFLTSCDKKNESPVCEFETPAEGNYFLPGEVIVISINASDKEGALKQLDFYINDDLVYTFEDTPYKVNLETWGVDIGDYTFKAVAIDNDGKQTSAEIIISLGAGIVYDDKIYDLDFGILEDYGEVTPTSWNFDITLLSASLLSTDIGSAIYIELFSSSSVSPVSGEYAFDPFSTGAENTFDYSDFGIDYDFNTDIGVLGEVTDGYVLLDKTGNTYKIFVNATSTSTGKPVLAYYEGALTTLKKTKSETKKGVLNFKITN